MEMEQYKLAENINKLSEILTNQKGSVYTFYRDDRVKNIWEKYIWAEHTPSGEYCISHYSENEGMIVSTYFKYNSDTYRCYLKYLTQITIDDFMKGIQQIIINLLNENNDLKIAQKLEDVKFTDDEFKDLICKLYDLKAESRNEMEQLKETIDVKLSEIIEKVEDIIDKG